MTEEGDSQGEAPGSQGSPAVLGLGPGGSKGSWVGAVQGSRVLKKYDVEVLMKDGVGSVVVPEEITKDAEPLWEDFLIGKFLDDAPHIAKIHAIVNKIWAINGSKQMIDVFEVNATSMKFRVPNQADRNRILRRGMWNLAGIPVVVAKWSPVIAKEKAPQQSIPMWVHLKNVPIKLFSWKGLSFVSSPIGEPVRLHSDTSQCLNLEVAKIFMKVDLSSDLPRRMNFNIQGEDVLVEYSYPWLPARCKKCEKWGHTAKTCSGNKVPRGEFQKEQENIVDRTEESVVKKSLEAVVVDDNSTNEQNEAPLPISEVKGTEAQNVELIEVMEELEQGSLPVTEMEQRHKEVHIQQSVEQRAGVEVTLGAESSGSTEQGVAELEKSSEWIDVSPGKSSRSPAKEMELTFGQVAILTNSRFSVLSEEEGEIVEDAREEAVDMGVADAARSQSEKEKITPRPSLPRDSKQKHKFLGDKSVQKAQDTDPSDLKKRKPRLH